MGRAAGARDDSPVEDDAADLGDLRAEPPGRGRRRVVA